MHSGSLEGESERDNEREKIMWISGGEGDGAER